MKQEISYSQQGDYQIPNITMPEQRQVQIGRFGRMRQQFLREKRKMIYFQLLTDCKLLQHLSEIDRQARTMQEQLIRQMMQTEEVSEKLKDENMMLWVQKMNNIQARATEIVETELIYK